MYKSNRLVDGTATSLLELTDLDVTHLGLVKRGANRRPFYILKSMEGVKQMKNHNILEHYSIDADGMLSTPFSLVVSGLISKGFGAGEAYVLAGQEVPELAEAHDMVQDAISTSDYRGLPAELAATARQLYNDAGVAKEPEPTDSADEHEFIKLVERVKRELFSTLPPAQAFTQAMVTVERAEPELARQYDRDTSGAPEHFIDVSPDVDVSTHPFLVEVEKLRLREFGNLAKPQGFAKAMIAVERSRPELAREYELATRQ